MNNNAAPADPSNALLEGYRPPEGVADELLRRDGTMRPVWKPLIDHLSGQSPEQIAAAFTRGNQHLQDAGVYYRQYGSGGSAERDWPLSHVPVMIDEAEWAELAEGITQRAELLEKVMADLYGPADLIQKGLLPAQLVAGSPEWLRPLVGVPPASGQYLHVLAFEVGRSPDGSWLVLGDRAQAPSGSGFALENRMASARIFPDLYPQSNVRRLAGFFRAFRDTLDHLRSDGKGRVAILTPGQHTDTYFEHAYIARYLGFLLLECEDLRVVDGRLVMRSINGLEPVSVLWRRLDSRYADPLELDEESHLGTPGLVGALRAGSFSMLNALGSGVLETRALMAFLPRICREVTGEELKLPNIATWWCGQERERDYVRDNLDGMMIGPALSTDLPFDIDSSTALGGRFRKAAQQRVRDWLDDNGPDLVGQEAATLSTTPAMIDGQLVPRPMILRVFALRTPTGWTVMPGGYARIGRTENPTALAMQAGGSVADVWVVSQKPVDQDTLADGASGRFLRRVPGRLPARAADNLFWLGRYVERAGFCVRTLRAYHLRLSESGGVQTPVLERLSGFLGLLGIDPSDDPVPGELLSLFDASRACAGKVRDRFSDDGWHALNELAGAARSIAADPEAISDIPRAMSMLLRRLAGFDGLVNDNMFRSSGWRFMSMGRALERGAQLTSLLETFVDDEAPYGSFDLAIDIGDSTMTHRRRYPVEINRNTVIDLLALDPENPRSVFFQAGVLKDQEALLPQQNAGSTQMTEATRQILRLHTALAVALPEELGPADFQGFWQQFMAISDAIHSRYFG